MNHRACTQWTIKIQGEGMEFYISNIPFKDIADSAAEGIRKNNPNYYVSVYFATSQTIQELNKP